MNLSIKILLAAEGFSETDIAAVEKALPAAERLVALVEKIAPLIPTTVQSDIATVAPVLGKILTIVKGT